MFRRYRALWKIATLLCDVVMAFGALYFAHWLKFTSGMFGGSARGATPHELLSFIIVTAFLILFFKLNHLYRYKIISDNLTQLPRIFLGCLQCFSFLLLYLFIQKSPYLDERMFIGLSFTLTILFVFLGRSILIRLLILLMKRLGWWSKSTLLIGSSKNIEELLKRLLHTKNGYFHVTSVLYFDNPEPDQTKISEDIACYFGQDQLDTALAKHNVKETIIATDDDDPAILISLLRRCRMRGRPVNVSSEYFNIIPQRLLVDQFDGHKFARFDYTGRWSRNTLKHTSDFLISAIALLLLSPFLLLIALLIKLTSKGPVFYVDTMIGRNQKTFKMYKFRTMRPETSPNKHQEYVSDFIQGKIQSAKVFKITDDDRVTPVGKFLRKFSIDELPQLINILKGEMSLVGPRPCKRYEYELYEDWHKLRFAVRPGLTGPWQALARSDVPFREMIVLDLFYVFSSNFWLDIELIFRTIGVIFSGRGGA